MAGKPPIKASPIPVSTAMRRNFLKFNMKSTFHLSLKIKGLT